MTQSNSGERDFDAVIDRVWRLTAPEENADEELTDSLVMSGPRDFLPSVFDVTGLATSAVAAAGLAAAELLAARRGSDVPGVAIDSRMAGAVFAAEALLEPVGWEQAALWDPIAGNYRAADRWIRLHTNYTHHRRAVEQVLGVSSRAEVEQAVARLDAGELEAAIIAAGGAAAVMYDRDEWLESPAGSATADSPVLTFSERKRSGLTSGLEQVDLSLPFAGLRVLDLTRVIAGPVCTKFLAAYGADVLRIDPPGFQEVASLLPETTLGKRRAALDLHAPSGREAFERLLAEADVLVSGLRARALDRLGCDDRALLAINPDLTIASLDAYGWDGPWRERRGFDSLVQMSCGIAAAGALAAGREEPQPLPVQALDHATGWLLAAAIARGLTRRIKRGSVTRVRASLIATANLLWSLGSPDGEFPPRDRTRLSLTETETDWGPVRRVPLPTRIEGVEPRWSEPAGPLGIHPASWCER